MEAIVQSRNSRLISSKRDDFGLQRSWRKTDSTRPSVEGRVLSLALDAEPSLADTGCWRSNKKDRSSSNGTDIETGSCLTEDSEACSFLQTPNLPVWHNA
jgi:hypothetical protein